MSSRYQFWKISHEKGHTVDQWMTMLHTQANQYTFGTSVIEPICEQFTVGIND